MTVKRARKTVAALEKVIQTAAERIQQSPNGPSTDKLSALARLVNSTATLTTADLASASRTMSKPESQRRDDAEMNGEEGYYERLLDDERQ